MVVPIIAGAAARAAGGAAVRGAATRGAAGRAAAGRAGQSSGNLTPTRTGGAPKIQQSVKNFQKVTEQFGAQKHQVRITTVVIGFLTVTALLFDGLQFLFSFFHVIPWIGTSVAFVVTKFLAFVAFAVFGIWFALLRVSYFSGKQALLKVATILGVTTVELIPLIDGIPAITFGVLVVIVVSRIEDAAGNPDEEKKQAAQRQAAAQAAANDSQNQQRAYAMAQMQEAQQQEEQEAMMAAAANDEFSAAEQEYATQRRVQQMVDIVPRRPAPTRVTSEMVRAELGKRAA